MKILGLALVVFGCAAVNKMLELSTEASVIGIVIAAGYYIMTNCNPTNN